MKEIHDILVEFANWRGQPAALATLVRVEGSSYRRAGARMLIMPGGRTVGSLSGGCIEQEIALRARAILQGGPPSLVSFDTHLRYGCHGKIDILIERAPATFFADLATHLSVRKCCLAVTRFEGPSDALGSRISETADGSEPGLFVQAIHPPIRLLVAGGGPDKEPLRHLCSLLGWQAVEIVEAASFSFEPDEWTAAIVKSHNYGRDFTALQKLLPLQLRYVGLIGSRQRRDQLLHNLLAVGITINAGFFSPAGLDLGAETPEEIALAVVSEIQREFGRGSGQSLRERKTTIHAKPVGSLLSST